MNTRMDKYTETPVLKSRAAKNKDLYEKINNINIEGYDVNNNTTILEEDISNIDVDRVKDMLDKRYRDEYNRKSLGKIEINENELNENNVDTKEYDINRILEKAKEGQNVNYEQERLKSIHNTQYDILKNLNVESKEEEIDDSEENIINLINTITELELKNSDKMGNTTALDLLNDLSDNDTDTIYKTMELDKEEISTKSENNLDEEDLSIEEKYEDFKELERDLKSNNIAIKIVSIVFVIILLILAFIFFNNYFNLGLL